AAGLIPAARAALESIGGSTLLLTKARGDETRCAHAAIEQGATTIAVLGGDGTVSQVACELVRQKSTVPLAIFGAGTGNDFAKSLNAPIHNFAAMTELIASTQIFTIDAGRVDDTIFVNSAGFGFDAEVVRTISQTGQFSGKFVYAATAIQQLFRYPGFDARITDSDWIDARKLSARWLTLVFANGGWFGGAFRIAPAATLTDGLLDSVFVRDTTAWRRVSIFGRAMGGKHTGLREVGIAQNSRWTLEFSSPPVYQADGELRQAASATVIVSVLPAALRIVSPVPY
ncbi:MAG: diacylglycerol kinase family protein, partial [Gemmatimonadaceae bacterium]